MTDKKVSEISGIIYRTFHKWKKDRIDLYKVVRLGAIATHLDYTENELKFIREKRARELAQLKSLE